jgi:hypothetical protein
MEIIASSLKREKRHRNVVITKKTKCRTFLSLLTSLVNGTVSALVVCSPDEIRRQHNDMGVCLYIMSLTSAIGGVLDANGFRVQV